MALNRARQQVRGAFLSLIEDAAYHIEKEDALTVHKFAHFVGILESATVEFGSEAVFKHLMQMHKDLSR